MKTTNNRNYDIIKVQSAGLRPNPHLLFASQKVSKKALDSCKLPNLCHFERSEKSLYLGESKDFKTHPLTPSAREGEIRVSHLRGENFLQGSITPLNPQNYDSCESFLLTFCKAKVSKNSVATKLHLESVVGEGERLRGGGSDFAIQAPPPLAKMRARQDSSANQIWRNRDSFGKNSCDSRESPLKEPTRHSLSKKRAGFGMMFAVIITVLVATLGILALKFSSQALNTTTNEYIAIQLDLYAQSTVELAILYIQRNGFVYNENATFTDIANNTNKRANVMEPITKYINYGNTDVQYKFKYKMTPLTDNGVYDLQVDANGSATKDSYQTKSLQEVRNAFVLDIAGSVVSPVTGQTFRVTKRQIIKP